MILTLKTMMNSMSLNGMNAALIIVAAGSSTRMGTSVKKEYLPLNGGTVLSETAAVFLKAFPFSQIVIVHPKDGIDGAKKALYANPENGELFSATRFIFAEGGNTRQSSVHNALECLYHQSEKKALPQLVLIHDGARPFLSTGLVTRTLEASAEYGAAVPALQPVDTQKEIDADRNIIRHLVRADLAAVQTPQGFRFNEILEAHRKAGNDGKEYTDDTEIWDNYNSSKTHVIKGESSNKKITYPGDIDTSKTGGKKNMIRTGIGYDLHRLTEGRKLILGGVEFDFSKGEDGHSDGDVLLHAVTDALLGASGLGDIGSYFPPSDPQWKNADSRMLLKTVWKDIKKAGWNLENIDCVIKLEQPKFLPKRNEVIKSIAAVLEADPSQIFVKAKTGEKIGKVGRGEAVEAYVTCLLSK